MGKITIYSQACNEIAGFRSMSEEFTRKLVINGKSKSTYQNYLRQIAKLSLYYGCLPLDLDTDQVEEYLYYLIQKDTDAQSSFKHLVYGLRKLYLLMDREDLQLALPSIGRAEKLPVVLSTQEVKSLLKAPKHLSQRVMFGLIYDTGLRIEELTCLLIADVDLDRRQIHVQVCHHVGACRAWYQKTPGPGQPKEIPVREQGEERQSYKQNQNKDPAKGSC